MASEIRPVSVSAAQAGIIDDQAAVAFAHYCRNLLLSGVPIGPYDPVRASQHFALKIQNAQQLQTTIDAFHTPESLSFFILAAVESQNVELLSYIQEKRPLQFDVSFKQAVQLALKRYEIDLFRYSFFDALSDHRFTDFFSSERLKDSLLSPDHLESAFYILDRLPVGKLDKEVFFEVMQSAVDCADYSDLAGQYLNALLRSPHNCLEPGDYVAIFNQSCTGNSPDNRGGLRALLTKSLDILGVNDVFCTTIHKPEGIVRKVLPLIFETHGHDMWIDALKEEIYHGNETVREIARSYPIVWNRIFPLEPDRPEAKVPDGVDVPASEPLIDEDGAFVVARGQSPADLPEESSLVEIAAAFHRVFNS